MFRQNKNTGLCPEQIMLVVHNYFSDDVVEIFISRVYYLENLLDVQNY